MILVPVYCRCIFNKLNLSLHFFLNICYVLAGKKVDQTDLQQKQSSLVKQVLTSSRLFCACTFLTMRRKMIVSARTQTQRPRLMKLIPISRRRLWHIKTVVLFFCFEWLGTKTAVQTFCFEWLGTKRDVPTSVLNTLVVPLTWLDTTTAVPTSVLNTCGSYTMHD